MSRGKPFLAIPEVSNLSGLGVIDNDTQLDRQTDQQTLKTFVDDIFEKKFDNFIYEFLDNMFCHFFWTTFDNPEYALKSGMKHKISTLIFIQFFSLLTTQKSFQFFLQGKNRGFKNRTRKKEERLF